MAFLELRIPPPLVMLAFGAAMWAACGIPQPLDAAGAGDVGHGAEPCACDG